MLWSDALQTALRIDSRRDDGGASRSVTLQPHPAMPTSQLPWRGIDAWTQRVYDDFLD